MKKLVICSLILMSLLITMVSAENSYLGSFKQGESFTISQTCDTCTYVILDSVKCPDQVRSYNISMTKYGNTYTTMFNDTIVIGAYTYNVCGDKDGTYQCEAIDFDVTSSGSTGGSNIVFYVLVILILYAMTIISFWGKNEIFTILSGMAMIGLGIYMVNNGIMIYRDWITLYFSYFTIAVGAIAALLAIVEELEVF